MFHSCQLVSCMSGVRSLSTSSVTLAKSYKLIVAGGGAGGCSVAAKFAKKLGAGQVAVIEPSQTHYYQPMWTMVGGGMKTLSQSARPMSSVLPVKADWIQDRVSQFHPSENKVVTASGEELSYEFLVVALGLQVNFDRVEGLLDALETPGVCSNYSPVHVTKTLKSLQSFKEGNAIFTFPNTPIKCAGAPQKIMYISDEYLRKHGKRNKANILYNSSLAVLFGVKKYAEALWKVVKERDIHVNLRHNLIRVKPDTREAVFQLLDEPDKTATFPYEMLHVAPPMSAPDVLKAHPELVDAAGFLDVNKETLQHNSHPNIFGIGDCTSIPTAKTAAAVAAEAGILSRNLRAVMDGKQLTGAYDGYTSCPLVTGYSKCILAEFDFNGNPLETFPINQGKERRSMFHLKKDMMPKMYFDMMLKGAWNGPGALRKAMHLGMK